MWWLFTCLEPRRCGRPQFFSRKAMMTSGIPILGNIYIYTHTLYIYIHTIYIYIHIRVWLFKGRWSCRTMYPAGTECGMWLIECCFPYQLGGLSWGMRYLNMQICKVKRHQLFPWLTPPDDLEASIPLAFEGVKNALWGSKVSCSSATCMAGVVRIRRQGFCLGGLLELSTTRGFPWMWPT